MAQRFSNRHRDELYGVGRWTTSPVPSTSPRAFAVTAPGGYAPRLAYDSWVAVGVGNRGPLTHLQPRPGMGARVGQMQAGMRWSPWQIGPRTPRGFRLQAVRPFAGMGAGIGG